MTTNFRHIGNIAMIAAALLLAGCDTMDSTQKTAPADATRALPRRQPQSHRNRHHHQPR
ncbi:putative lipoprotein [Collimonas arenae]|uniref:Putative lipoprotein n=1 Tax=Collimonas arenae TaxID=279058 RepID=A0A127QCX0_9BURK|nr:hypothetical protein [Collimonas arenae]AMP07923.1 putative lipoprotein [Collimonas arenae]